MTSRPPVDQPPSGAVDVDGPRRAGGPGDGRWAGVLFTGSSLLDAASDLRREVAATTFPLPRGGVDQAQAVRVRVLDQLDDHLLPRLRELSSPAVVVVAGSTGAGKSTLVNSLLGTQVSPAGVLRPTTRRPVLAHHPQDAELLTDHPLLGIVDVVEHDVVPRGLAVVDAPDLDSLVVENREIAHRLLEAADLWVFVTTAARYGDALPWEVLDRASERGTSMAMVLNRVPDDAMVTVRGELMHRLRDRGMAAVPLFLVPDVGPHEGLLDPVLVAPMLRWLTMVAGPDRARSVILRTQRGSFGVLRPWVEELVEAVQAQVDARAALGALVESATDGPADRTAGLVTEGTVAQGPVRSLWAAATTSGGPLAGRWSPYRGRSTRARVLVDLAEELASAVEVAFASARRRGQGAVDEVLRAASDVGGSAVLDALEQVRAVEQGIDEPARTSVDQWLRVADGEVMAVQAADDRAAVKAVGRLVRMVGQDGAGTLVALGAAGVDGARDALARVIGREPATLAVERVREDLVRRAREHAVAGADPARAVLDGLGPADDAASALSLRLAVIKGAL